MKIRPAAPLTSDPTVRVPRRRRGLATVGAGLLLISTVLIAGAPAAAAAPPTSGQDVTTTAPSPDSAATAATAASTAGDPIQTSSDPAPAVASTSAADSSTSSTTSSTTAESTAPVDSKVAALQAAAVAAAAAPASTVGNACLPGQGVTVAVDYAPTPDALQLGCAIGPQVDMMTAARGAGFTITFSDTAPPFLTGIGNAGFATPVVETGTGTEFPRSFWSIYLNTTTGQPNAPLTTTLTFAQTGVDGGPLAVDTVLLFDFVPDYLSDPPDAPRVAYADLSAAVPGDAAVNPPAYSASADGDALAAAGWIGRQLEANGGVLPGASGTDYGLTIDAIFALAAAGVGGTDITTAAQRDLSVRYGVHRRTGRFGGQRRQDRQDHPCSPGCRSGSHRLPRWVRWHQEPAGGTAPGDDARRHVRA